MKNILSAPFRMVTRLWRKMRQKRQARAVEKKWGRVIRKLDEAYEKISRLENKHPSDDNHAPPQA